MPVGLWALDKEHDISLFWPPQPLVRKLRVDGHVSVVEQDGVKLRDRAQLHAVVGYAAVGDGACGLK